MVKMVMPGLKTLDMRTVRPMPTEQRLRGRAGVKDRESVLRDEPLCRTCRAAGRVTMAIVVDHIVPLAHGGTNARSNKQPLCQPCHDAKTAQDFARR